MRTLGIVLIAIVMAAPAAPAQSSQKSQIAADAASLWLGYVDSGDYGKSWDTAAELFQKAISKQDWAKQLNAMRNPLGAVESRDQFSATYSTQLPGAPDGEYVVVRFQTRFERKKSAVETVTLNFDRDKWRVAGYFIK